LCHRRRGSQLVEEAAIILIAIVFVSAIFAVDRRIINLQTAICDLSKL